MANYSASVDITEIEKFSNLSDSWWDVNGPFKQLHNINSIRIKYIIDNINKIKKTVHGLKILDIGCGGGLLCEPFARLGAIVTAIDASDRNISVAQIHSKKMNLNIDYRNTTTEDLVNTKEKWDIIFSMEVIEHVNDIESFINSKSKLLKDDGIMFVSTLNKTLKSYLLAIIAAEYILGWLPKKTHDYDKFIKPSMIASYLRNNDMMINEIRGISYNLIRNKWYISSDIDVNYMLYASKINSFTSNQYVINSNNN